MPEARPPSSGRAEEITVPSDGMNASAIPVAAISDAGRTSTWCSASSGVRHAGLGHSDHVTVHISARLAWHMDGWNGHVCGNPASNVYCVGKDSYPGELIREQRDLEWESRRDVAGRPCHRINGIPPCIYSVNAFGRDELTAVAEAPEWMYPGSRREWSLPPATVAIWPYEQMYRDEVRRGQSYDYDLRLQYARDYFAQVTEGKSLVFYYANYSNPFSEDDERQYVIVGMSRIK